MDDIKYKTSDTLEALDFYDIIINLNSLYNVSSINAKNKDYGIQIQMTEKGKENYERYNKIDSNIIGMLGTSNAGKSKILSLLTSLSIPDGYTIQTKGISIKYPKEETSNYICLDSEGSEMPITETSYLSKQDEDAKDPNKFKELKKLAILDKKSTEIFIQKFLLYFSNILIVVINQLTLNDQKFLNRIKKEKGIDKIFVCHNLKDFIKKEQVFDYIQNIFKNDIFLNCEKRIMTRIESNEDLEKNKDKDDHFYNYYTETIKHTDNTSTQIIHLFLSNDNQSEENTAREYFNNSAAEFLRAQIRSLSTRKFDAIKDFKKFFCESSDIYYEHEINKKPIEINDLIYNENVLSVKKELILKECNFDEYGESTYYSANIKPDYTYYKGIYKKKKKKKKKTESENENQEIEYECLIIEMELPGKIEDISFKTPVNYDDNKYDVIFTAKKVIKEDDNIKIYNNTIKDGIVELSFPISLDYCLFDINNKNKPPVFEHNGGIFTIYIPIVSEKKNKVEIEIAKKK